jgi:hypothetical protein
MNPTLTLASTLALATIASAQPAATAEPTTAPIVTEPESSRDTWAFTLSTDPSFTFRSDLDEDKGSVSIVRTNFAANFAGPIGDRLRLSIGLFGGVANYDFKDFRTGGVTFNDGPIDDAYEAGLSLLAIYSIDDQWYALARGSVLAGWEADADLGDSIFGTAAAGIGYHFSKNFSLALGGGFITRLEDNVGFLPLIVLNWQISDTLKLETTGVGLVLASTLSDQWSVYLRGGGDFHQYRLEDNNQVAPGGVLNDTRVPVGVGFEWKPCAGLTLSLEGGVVVYQQYELRNNDEEIDEIETDPAAYIAARLSYRF